MAILHKLAPEELRNVRLKPPESPFSIVLSDCYERALKGDNAALERIRMMQRMCEAVLFSIPPDLRVKKASEHTPINKLATLLFIKLVSIRKGRTRCSDSMLLKRIKDLRRYSKKTHSEWWKRAWDFAKATTDVEILELIRVIGEKRMNSFTEENLEEFKEALLIAANLSSSSTVIISHPDVCKWIEKRERAGVDYARRQAKRAAALRWPPRRRYGPN